MVADDLAAVLAQDGDEGVGDRLAAALGDRPPDDVGVGTEHQPDAGAEPSVERQHRVAGEPGEQGAALDGVEPPGRLVGAPQPRRREAGQPQRVARHAQRRQQVVEDGETAVDQRIQHAPPPPTVGTEAVGRLVERTPQDRRAAVERVGERDLGVAPHHAVGLERQGAQRRRAETHRVHGGAHVVTEAGPRQLGGPAATAGRRCRLEHDDPASGLRHGDGGHEPVRSGADDDDVRAVCHCRRRHTTTLRTVAPESSISCSAWAAH